MSGEDLLETGHGGSNVDDSSCKGIGGVKEFEHSCNNNPIVSQWLEVVNAIGLCTQSPPDSFIFYDP